MVGSAAILALWSVLNVLSATAEVPQISHPVTDLAGVLRPEDEEQIARELVMHREATGVQLAVLIIDSSKPRDIADYAQAVFDRWGGGSKERDDGALFVLAISDRRSRLHLGYGLEAVIPDAVAKHMLDDLRPWLVARDYARATRELVRSVQTRTDHLSPGDPIAPPFGARAWLGVVIVALGVGLGIGWAIAFKRGWRAYKQRKGRFGPKRKWWVRFGLACAFLVRQRPVYVALGGLALAQLLLAQVVSSGHGYVMPYSLLYWNFILAGWLIGGTRKAISITVAVFAGGVLVLGIFGSGQPPYADESSLFGTVLAVLGLFWGANVIFLPAVAGGRGGGGSYSSSYSSSSSSYSYSSSSSSSSYSSSSYSGGGGSSGGGGASSSW